MPKNLPRFAERSFALMCAVSGVTCNRCEEDVNGWDYIIELPPLNTPDVPIDMRPGPQIAFVQVKSSTRGPVTKLKLSNSLRFSQSPSPCFVVLFVREKSGSVIETYVEHFWSALMSRTLEMTRQTDASGREDLHRRYLTLHFERQKMQDTPIEFIRRTIESIGAPYEDEKRKIMNSAGFEDSCIHGTLGFESGVTIEDIVAHQIDRKEGLPLSHFAAFSERFGITSPKPFVEHSGGVLRIRPNPVDCTIILSSVASDEQLSFAGKMIVPSFPGLPMDKLKVRFLTTFIDIVLEPAAGKGKIIVTQQPEAKIPLTDLARFVRLRCLARGGTLDVKIIFQGKMLIGGTISSVELSEGAFYAILDPFLQLVMNEASQFSEVELSLSDLIAEIDKIEEFMSLIQVEEITLKAELDRRFPSNPLSAYASYVAHITINNYTVVAFVLRPGSPIFEENRVVLKLGLPIQRAINVLQGSADDNATFARVEDERRRSLFDKKYPGSLMAHLGDATEVVRRLGQSDDP
jgi:hypothetical protein